LNGKNKLKENITYSTTSVRNGQSYDLNLLLKGNDALTIKIINNTGIEEVEKYTRMK